MKTNTRNLLISFLLMIAMLLGVLAITSQTAFAVSRPDPTKICADKIYVGGVELGLGQYVKNGETTPIDGAPAEDATGFASYTEGGTLVLVDYTYTGKGYEYSSGNYALVYSTGTLQVAGGGVNTLKQTQSYNMGIYSVGALTLSPSGTLTIEGENCSCLYSNNEIIFESDLGTVNLKSTGNATAIVSYDNDGDALDEQAIIVNGGDIYVETFYPISDLTINYGAFKVSSSQNALSLSQMPDISNYNGGYTITLSENEDGSNPETYNQDTIGTFNTENLADYKYFRIAPPAKTAINSVSVSDIDLPQIGEAFVYPDEAALTYGGEYIAVGCWMERYTGTKWEDYSESTDVVEHSVKYRYVLTLRPNAGYTFSEEMTNNNVTINGKGGVVLMVFPDDAFTNKVEVALEFSYEAPATDYDITIAGKDGSTTIGVDITSENCTDVLGDGTVSFNPTTKTLTLNNYVYDGEGLRVDDGGYLAVTADVPVEGLTIVLVGENSITVSGSDSAGMVFFGEGNLTVKGNGSLSINTIMYGITLQSDSGKLTIENAKLNITTTGAMAIGIQATDFVMTSGDVKITASMIGIGTSNENGICINGGSVEIDSALGGYAFIYLDFEHMTFNPIKPDLSGYVGAYKMTAGINADGSGASEFNEVYLTSYKYVNITEIESYGITIADKDELGATVGVLITEENCTDVLGDGTVSYAPATNTLTLNGYKYEGSGFEYNGDKFGINVPKSIGTLNIVLKGENVIDVTKTDTLARMRISSIGVYTWETDVVFSGDGSLVISATDGGLFIIGEDAQSLEIKGGNITVNACDSIDAKYFKMSGGNLTVNATEIDGDIASAIYSYEFRMSGGNLKITSAGLGVEMWHDSDEDAPPTISGGTFEISTKIVGGAFCYYNSDEDVCVAIAPDLTNYVGTYNMTAGVNADGSDAVEFNEGDLSSYRYVKIEHIHNYGTAWKSDENNHWNECVCGDKANIAAHVDENSDSTCDVCGKTMVNPSGHKVIVNGETKYYADGESVTVTAKEPAEGKVFKGWKNENGEIVSTDKSYTFLATGETTLTAVYEDQLTTENGLSGGAIAGIVIGTVAVVGIGGFAIFWFVIKKKKPHISIKKNNRC